MRLSETSPGSSTGGRSAKVGPRTDVAQNLSAEREANHPQTGDERDWQTLSENWVGTGRTAIFENFRLKTSSIFNDLMNAEMPPNLSYVTQANSSGKGDGRWKTGKGQTG